MQDDVSKLIIQSFAEIAKDKSIERDVLLSILEDVFRSMIIKKYESDEAFDVILNPDRGELQILHIREVVPDDEFSSEVTEIAHSKAVELDPDLELYDEFAQEISIMSFGRRAVMSARQQLAQRIREIEKENIFDDYSDRVGEIVLGDVYQVRPNKDILVNHNGIELLLPKREQIYKDRFRKGDTIRAVVSEVRKHNGNPTVIISRTSPLFLERMFENEIPEIFDGIIEIIRVSREPGDRSKVAVLSHDERVDPVGACVGMKGIRIHSVVRELQNENIDVIPYTKDMKEFIRRALQPADIGQVEINPEGTHAKVTVAANQVSKAIGRSGVNIRLASKLVGIEIDVFREADEEDDIDIYEFEVDFGREVIDTLYNIGCDSARAVLELSSKEIVRRTNNEIDEATANRIIKIISEEFDDD